MTPNQKSLAENCWLTATKIKMAESKRNRKRKLKISSEVELPKGVTADFDGQQLTIKGPKGEVQRIMGKQLTAKVEGSKIIFESGRDTKDNKSMLGSLTAHVKNIVRGVVENHNYTLKICSGHFPMTVTVSDNKLHVKNFLGEKVSRVLALKQGAAVKVDGALIHVSSASKELAGQVSGDIEQLTSRPGFDNRVFQDGIYIINKDGKELK